MNYKYKVFLKKLFFYGLIGGFSASLDTAFFILLSSIIGIQNLISNFYSVNTGILVSFLLNTYFNFKTKDKIKRRAAKFFCIAYSGLLLSSLIMWTGADILKISIIYVKLMSVLVVALFQFILNYIITFNKN